MVHYNFFNYFSAEPDAPTSITFVRDCSNFRPHLQWRVGEANNDPMKFVKVEYTSDYPDDANTWYVAGEVMGESVNQFEFGSILTPITLPGNARIKFRATAVNQVGPSKLSRATDPLLCITPPKRPSNNPVNVSLVVLNVGESNIVWGVSIIPVLFLIVLRTMRGSPQAVSNCRSSIRKIFYPLVDILFCNPVPVAVTSFRG